MSDAEISRLALNCLGVGFCLGLIVSALIDWAVRKAIDKAADRRIRQNRKP